ncbi:mycofactocin system GMC family oxidoreductase MftG [Rhodococcus kronopolitis]|uniref:Mycofactocin system GMC family oxidoreductase MftG n=1 Tax=Rhodococcus kronopolitis TaxID=1460226 RepID=A0ABV9FXD8_9NOCA
MPAPATVADVIVVGGGSAGCVVAARLSENPYCTVVLVEAGPPAPAPGPVGTLPVGPGSELVWSYSAELEPGIPATLARGRVLGGSGAVNGGYFVRGTAADFERWPASWSYRAVLPYFRRLETDPVGERRWHGDDGPMPVTRTPAADLHPVSRAFVAAATSAGFGYQADLNEPDAVGVGPVPRNAASGLRVSTADAYLGAGPARPNLRVHTGTTARRLLFAGTRVVGVEVEEQGRGWALHADRVVVCCGAVATPHLLMHSGIGPAQELSELGLDVLVDRQGVGRGFTDHPEVTVGYRRRPLPHRSTTPLLEAVLEAELDTGPVELRPYTATFGEAIPGVSDPLGRLGVALMRPDSRGEVVLRSADPSAAPLVRYRYLRTAADRAGLRAGLDLAERLLRSDEFAGLLDPPEPGAAAAAMRAGVGTSMHLSGSCRMGSGAHPGDVVDERCRVLGVQGLWLADTSVMPELTSRGPHATAVMIAERVAGFIEM